MIPRLGLWSFHTSNLHDFPAIDIHIARKSPKQVAFVTDKSRDSEHERTERQRLFAKRLLGNRD